MANTDGDITEAEYLLWMHPQLAFRRATEVFESASHASSGLYASLKDGTLLAVAEEATSNYVRRPYRFIPPDHWKALKYLQSYAAFWRTAIIEVEIPAAHSRATAHHYHGVRFEPLQVAKVIGPAALKPPIKTVHQGFSVSDPDHQSRAREALRGVPEPEQEVARPPVNLGGRPSKMFWDDLWVEMFRRLWLGKLTPKTQADIEKAMLEWAKSKGHKLGETTVKKPAQKLFKAYKSEVQN